MVGINMSPIAALISKPLRSGCCSSPASNSRFYLETDEEKDQCNQTIINQVQKGLFDGPVSKD